MTINRGNLVWPIDITYVSLEKGFAYLFAIMDCYSSEILSWTLSNTMHSHFCIKALEQTFERYLVSEFYISPLKTDFYP